MNKEFIPYEEALALKELGFDEPCFGYYEPNKEFNYINWEVFKDFPYLAKNSEWQDLYGAPTFSQALRWFREKYLLDSWIYCSDEEKGYFAIIVSCKRLVFYNENKNTYEEAELACLQKLVEIVKSKV